MLIYINNINNYTRDMIKFSLDYEECFYRTQVIVRHEQTFLIHITKMDRFSLKHTFGTVLYVRSEKENNIIPIILINIACKLLKY